MGKAESVKRTLELQIQWIAENDAHKFPGWQNVTQSIREAINFIDEQCKLIELQHSALRGSADMVSILFAKFDELNERGKP